MERLSTGNDQVDLILNGGFPESSIHIVMGSPGSGKTIFAEQLAFANAGGDRPILYLTTFSEPLAKVVTYLQEYSFARPEHIGTDIVYESIAEELSSDPERLRSLVQGLIQQYRPRIIVIDSFKAIAELIPDAASWRRILYDLAGLLSAYHATCFWVGEYTSDMITHRPEFAVADGIIELMRDQRSTRDERYLRVVKLRGSRFLDGYHAFCITSDGLQVSPRLISPTVPIDYAPIAERLKSGVAGLDEMIETGWLRGTSTIVSGPSGAGKTALGLHFLLEGARTGEPGLLVNFQETPMQLNRVMRHFGWNPAELLGTGKLGLLYTSPVELQIDTILTELFRRIQAQKIQRLVIDSLGDLARSSADQLRFRDYLYALVQQLAQRNITSMLLLETSGMRDENERAGSDVSNLSDNMLVLEMSLTDDLTRHIRIVKARGSAHDGRRHVLRITSRGIIVE